MRSGNGSLRELALLFFRLGATAFGGPAAHIAMMEDEVVRRRRWLDHDEFLDLLGATNLIPGPNSTELAIHIGHRRAGWPGLVVAGTAFIVPATVIVMLIAWTYVRYGSLPRAQSLLYGVKPVMIAVVLQALWGLGKSALKTRLLIATGIVAAALSLAGVNELVVLFGCGLALLATKARASRVAADGGTIAAIFFVFAKIGSVLFGSGYVLLAFLRADLVERHHWLTEGQLLDAITVGQITPGPVFTTATFIGYVLSGPAGALAATVGIFLPAFIFVAISSPWIPRLRRSPLASAFLDGVNVASLALMAAVTVQLARSTLVDAVTIALTALSALLLVRFKVNSVWLIAAGALIGLLWH